MTRLLPALLLASCTLETEGASELIMSDYDTRVECANGDSGSLVATEPTNVRGWECQARKDGQRLYADCQSGEAVFSLFCDAAFGVPTSAAQVGDCTIQVWCES